MMINSNPLEGLVKIILILVVIGSVVGILVSGTDLFNPTDAEIRMMKAQEDLQNSDIAQQHTREMNQIQEASAQEWDHLKLQLAGSTGDVLMVVLLILGTSLGIGTIIFLAQVGQSRIIKARAEVQMWLVPDWSDESWRWNQIQKARHVEMLERTFVKERPADLKGRGKERPPQIPAPMELLDVDDPNL